MVALVQGDGLIIAARCVVLLAVWWAIHAVRIRCLARQAARDTARRDGLTPLRPVDGKDRP